MIVGVDVSSKRIDLAYLDAEGRPQRWHQQLDPKAHLIDRLRSIRIEWPYPQRYPGDTNQPHTAGQDITDIAIELPFAHQRVAVSALMATVGVITRQAPPWARVAWPSAGELRTAIGAKNNKADAHAFVHGAVCDLPDDRCALEGWDEHELDALVACIGWGRILAAQDAE